MWKTCAFSSPGRRSGAAARLGRLLFRFGLGARGSRAVDDETREKDDRENHQTEPQEVDQSAQAECQGHDYRCNK